MTSSRVSEIVDRVLKRLLPDSETQHQCSFCPEPSVASYQVREGEVPFNWRYGNEPQKTPDRSRMKVVRVCTAHKEQVPQ